MPASFLLLAFAGHLERKAWPYIVCGLLCVIATVGIVFGTGAWVVAAATLQGFAASAILILVLALPPLLSRPDDVHRVTAAMFTISYSCAVIVPVISGLAWDLTRHRPNGFPADRTVRDPAGHSGAGDQSCPSYRELVPCVRFLSEPKDPTRCA